MPSNTTSSHREATLAFLFALSCLAIPVVLVKWVPLLDYPNHYARMWLESGGVEIPPMSGMYQVVWKNASTNIGIDVIASTLSHLLPLQVVAHGLVVAALVLPPLGAVHLNRTVLGGAHWWQVGFVLLAWDFTLAAGFLNFQIGLGLALLGCSIDPVLSRKTVAARVAGRMGVGAVTLLMHAFAFAFYAALVAALALGPKLAPLKSARGLGHQIGRAAVACLPILALLVPFLLLAPKLPGSQGSQGSIRWQDLRDAGHALATAFVTYRPAVDAAFAGAFVLPVVLGAATRRIEVHAGLLLMASLLAVLSNFVPVEMGHTALIEKRFPPMAVLTLAASVRPTIPDSIRWRRVALALMLLVASSRTAWISRVWLSCQADFASVERALDQVPSGAAVLPLAHTVSAQDRKRSPTGRYISRGLPNYWSLPVLAIVQRHAFVPNLFTAAGKQPIRVLPPWDEIAVPEGPPPPVDQIVDPEAVPRYPYLADWRNRFDFILVVNADFPNEAGPMPSLPWVRLVSDQGFAQLYRVDRATKAAGSLGN